MIRVLIAEDETLVRRGLVKLLELEAGVEVVGEAQDGEEALELAARLAPDVVLLDLVMPRRGGLEVLAALSRVSGAPRCLVLTTFDDAEALLARPRAPAPPATCARTCRSRSCWGRSAPWPPATTTCSRR